MQPSSAGAASAAPLTAAGRITGVAIRYVEGTPLLGLVETTVSTLTHLPIDRVYWTDCTYKAIYCAMPEWERVIDQAMDAAGWPEDGSGVVMYTRLTNALLSVTITGDIGTECRIVTMNYQDAEAHGWIEC